MNSLFARLNQVITVAARLQEGERDTNADLFTIFTVWATDQIYFKAEREINNQ